MSRTPSTHLPAASTAAWAAYLASHTATAAPEASAAPPTPLSAADAARVQHHRDRLMDALHARDRQALRDAKACLLADAFGTLNAGPDASPAARPALRRALRELAWRMAAVLPRGAVD